MPVEPQYIDASAVEYADEFEPSVAPPPLTRAQVLTEARILLAQATGVGALVEQAAMNPHMRHDFLHAWRRWLGSVIGQCGFWERRPFDYDSALKNIREREAALKMWRVGLQMEISPPPPLVVGTAPPAEVRKPGILANVPWWVLIPAGLGVAVGGYYGMRYMFRMWFSPVDDTVQSMKRVTEYIPAPRQAQTQTQPPQQ